MNFNAHFCSLSQSVCLYVCLSARPSDMVCQQGRSQSDNLIKIIPNLINRMTYPFFKSFDGITILIESSVHIYKKLDL